MKPYEIKCLTITEEQKFYASEKSETFTRTTYCPEKVSAFPICPKRHQRFFWKRLTRPYIKS